VNLAKIAIEKKAVSYFATILLIVAGIASFFSLGQLEDPEFSVKTAVIATRYPGASAAEVELEVTDRLEVALQQLKSIDYLRSFSAPGYSQIWVNIKPAYWADQLPQVWDEMRRKIREVEGSLPRLKALCRPGRSVRWSTTILATFMVCLWASPATVFLTPRWKPRPRI